MRHILAHQARLLTTIEADLPRPGLSGGVSQAVRDAYFRCPRHLFVDRYQVVRGGPVLRQGEGEADAHLDFIYSNIGLGHVDAAGRALTSVNSPPSAVLHMLALLDLAPGHRVLEVGSGCGWLLGLIASMVGPRGQAIGLEIVPDLAEQSRASLGRAGIANATVIAGDGMAGHAEVAPFDRVIFTAGIWALSPAFFDQVREGGLLVVPLHVKGGCNDLLVLRRMPGRRFRSVTIIPAMFVDGAGATAEQLERPRPLHGLRLWPQLRGREILRMPMTFGMGGLGTQDANLFGWRTRAFRSFLSKIDPRMQTFIADLPIANDTLRSLLTSGMGVETIGLGLVDEARRSLAVCMAGELVGYGEPGAAHDLLAAYQAWCDLMMPGAEAFTVDLVPFEDAPPPGAGHWTGHWIERRGDIAMVWRLREDCQRASDQLAALSPPPRLAQAAALHQQ